MLSGDFSLIYLMKVVIFRVNLILIMLTIELVVQVEEYFLPIQSNQAFHPLLKYWIIFQLENLLVKFNTLPLAFCCVSVFRFVISCYQCQLSKFIACVIEKETVE